MRVKVQYFAVLRDRAGLGEEEFSTESTTARELADELIRVRALGLPSPMIRVAVNGRFVEDGYMIQPNDEVVLIPPVAGG